MLDVAVDDDLEVFEKGIVAQRIDVVSHLGAKALVQEEFEPQIWWETWCQL